MKKSVLRGNYDFSGSINTNILEPVALGGKATNLMCQTTRVDVYVLYVFQIINADNEEKYRQLLGSSEYEFLFDCGITISFRYSKTL